MIVESLRISEGKGMIGILILAHAFHRVAVLVGEIAAANPAIAPMRDIAQFSTCFPIGWRITITPLNRRRAALPVPSAGVCGWSGGGRCARAGICGRGLLGGCGRGLRFAMLWQEKGIHPGILEVRDRVSADNFQPELTQLICYRLDLPGGRHRLRLPRSQ